jgi:hypothetical protein
VKQYATFRTTDLRFGAPLDGPDWPDNLHGTLEEQQKKGWVVISTAIRPGACSHESPLYLFLLEREQQPSERGVE